MKRKTLAFFFLFLLICLSLPLPAYAKSYTAERFDVDLEVQAGGALAVTETVVLRFSGGPYSYFFREIEYNRLDSIENLRVYLDGSPLPEGTGPGEVEIERGDVLRITWHMSPTSDATREFRLEYTVLGAVRVNASGNEILWRAIPEEHEYEIAASKITLTYPDGVAPSSPPSIEGANAAMQRMGAGLAFTMQGIDDNDPLDVRAAFPAGSLVSQPPAWQLAEEQQRRENTAALPYGLGAAALVALLGAAVLLGFYQRTRRDDLAPLSFSSQQQTPPSDIAPGLAAKLAGGGNPSLATLFDLTQRGLLRIELSQGIFNSKKFELVRVPGQQMLRPHEEALLEALFEDREGQRERITFSELGSRIAGHQKSIDAPLDAQMKQYGWVDAGRESLRNRLMLGAMAVLVLGVLLALAAIIPLATPIRAALLGGGLALFVLGLVGAIAGAAFSVLTASGMQQASAWRSFTGYLKDVTRGREPTIRPDAFERYLPYAAGFGLASGWARFFEQQQDMPVPQWLSSLEASGVRFSDVSAAIIASQAASSSAASGGAGGASGGGASGAG